jgi:hypothetical protein
MSECCGIDTISGAPPAGGGVAAYECVCDVDWREEFAAQGAVDLNSPGATLVDQAGATWQTPSAATGPGNQVASTSWALTVNGLEVVGAGVAGLPLNASPIAPSLWINIADLGAAYGFDPDPTRMWVMQAFISAQNGDQNIEDSGIALRHVIGIPTGTGSSQILSAFGFSAGVANESQGFGDHNGTTGTFNRTDITDQDVPTIHYGGVGGSMAAYAGQFGADWPANGSLRSLIAFSSPSVVSAAVPNDVFTGFRITLFHRKTSAGGTGYNAVHQRFRLCRF